MGKTNLIKTVRGLDQTGPGDKGQVLTSLWKDLTESPGGQFHAAEESALRWLLKSMNGPSQAAETIRRYPLTWTILNCVFHRIPLFSLAKSLADRRFVSVLQQTLKDISKPTQEPASASPSPKRKRWQTPPYDLDHLKSLQGCLATGQAVFTLLKLLLSRLDDEAAVSRSRVGAEHIRSLFSASAAEAATIASAGLTLCDLRLVSDEGDALEGADEWIATLSAIWDLHLQGANDALEVATYLFKPACSILAKLESFSQIEQRDRSEALTTKWSSDLQKLVHRTLILPARTAFLQRQDFEAVIRALDVAGDKAGLASPALYFLAAGAPDPENERDMRRGNAAWMRRIFQGVEAQLRRLPHAKRNALMQHVLGQALQRAIHVDVDDLRAVCRDYALGKDGETDWSFVAKAAACNPDIFQGDNLLKEVCERSLEGGDEHREAILDFIGAVQKGFCIRRSYSGFLELWFAQLCSAEQRKLGANSPWFAFARRSDSPSTLIESELSPPMLLEVVDWLTRQDARAHSQALCIFSDTIARGLHSEPFIESMGTKLFDLVSPLARPKATALKWRVVSATISWVSLEERIRMWAQVKDELSKILRKKSIESAETFEGLKCCYTFWDYMSQDGNGIVDEAAALVEKFTVRLEEEIAPRDVVETEKLSSCLEGAGLEYNEECALQQYLAWYLLGSSRFLKLYWARKGELPSAISTALSAPKASVDALAALWDAILRNDTVLNDAKLSRSLIDRLITADTKSDGEKGWPGERGRMWIQTLSRIPGEVFSRQQREQVMTILERRRVRMVKHAKHVSLEGWKLVLDLSSKMMSRPTFYEGLQFDNLIGVADALSSFHFKESNGDDSLLDLIERYSTVAAATLKQMSENNDERSVKYFTESANFISDCDARDSTAFRITLLKTLTAELGRSPTFQSHADLGHLASKAERALAKRIASVLSDFLEDGELLAKHDTVMDLSLFAALDAAHAVDVPGLSQDKSSAVRTLEKSSREAMKGGDLRAWKIQIFLQTYLANDLESPRPTTFPSLVNLSAKSRGSLLKGYVAAVVKDMGMAGRAQYLAGLIDEFTGDSDTDGQILAIQYVVDQLIEQTDLHGKGEGVDLAAAHSELTLSLSRTSSNTVETCRVLQTLLDKKPQAMGQWNIDITLSTVAKLASAGPDAPFAWLCKLVGVIIRRHRLRLEGHHHILLTVMQALLRSLVGQASAAQEAMAQAYGRLITLICEPAAGAVARPQHQSALESATDAAKRSAGRHMYLLLMQYVKLQLEESVPRVVREALEPAMNTIFDITPPEVRKILNDAMDGSGRAVLREMFKRYTKFGKWNGV